MAHKTYAEHPGYLKPRAQHLARGKTPARNALKGVTKWVNGQPVIFYHRKGYGWHKGSYVKLELKGSGLTMRFGSNRQERRAEEAEARRRARRKSRAAIQERKQARLGL